MLFKRLIYLGFRISKPLQSDLCFEVGLPSTGAGLAAFVFLTAGWTISLAVAGRMKDSSAGSTMTVHLFNRLIVFLLHTLYQLFQSLIQRQHRIQEPLAGDGTLIFFRPERIDYVARAILRDTQTIAVIAAFLPDLLFDGRNHIHPLLLSQATGLL